MIAQPENSCIQTDTTSRHCVCADHNWFCPPQGPYVHPAPMAPRCLPCGYNVSGQHSSSALSFSCPSSTCEAVYWVPAPCIILQDNQVPRDCSGASMVLPTPSKIEAAFEQCCPCLKAPPKHHHSECTSPLAAEGMQPLPYEPPIGCPCTPQLLCQHDRRTDGTFTQHLRSQQAIGPNRADPPLWLFDEQCSQFSFKARAFVPPARNACCLLLNMCCAGSKPARPIEPTRCCGCSTIAARSPASRRNICSSLFCDSKVLILVAFHLA